MKSVKKILAMCLAIMMIVSCVPAAHAADVSNTAIDLDAKGSLTLYKYDLTNAEKDGVWDSIRHFRGSVWYRRLHSLAGAELCTAYRCHGLL